jgi:hypothetical protein
LLVRWLARREIAVETALFVAAQVNK